MDDQTQCQVDPHWERRSVRRTGPANRATTTLRVAVAQAGGRIAQMLAGFLVAIVGLAALYVTGRRLVEHGTFAMGEIAFFALGAVLLIAGFGIALGEPFWRQAGKAADLADGVFDRVRGKRGAASNE